MTQVIIDGDIFLYQCAFAAEREVCWDENEEFYTLFGELGPACRAFEGQVTSVLKIIGVKDYLICFTGKNVFRKSYDTAYKANRAGKRKPVVLSPLRDYIIKAHPTKRVDNLEADDLLGLLAGQSDIMVTSDKDLLTVPGLHFDPKIGSRGVVQVTPHEAIYTHFLQTLMGDSVDNIKGCPRIGPVTARKKLHAGPPSEMWEQVINLFSTAGLSEEYALTQARLTYILRGDDFDFTTNTVRDWEPGLYNQYDRTTPALDH